MSGIAHYNQKKQKKPRRKFMTNLVSKNNIIKASQVISQYVSKSPLRKSEYLSSVNRYNLYLKLENLNPTGSFKIRGASNALLENATTAKANGVVAASAGNHAQGVARVARSTKTQCTIFMPVYTPQIKIQATKNYGAEVVLEGQNYDESFAAAAKHSRRSGSLLIHAFADPNIINGQGTVGIELLEDLDHIDVVIIPIGGGGLISGISTYLKELKPKIKILGVQTTYYPAMRDKFLTETSDGIVKPIMTIADGIAVKSPGDLNYGIVQKYVDDIVTVDEDQISTAVFRLMENDHIISEGAGAAATAASLFAKSSLLQNLGKDSNVVSIVSGGNIDFNLLNKISAKVLKTQGRLMRIHAIIEDRPGNLAKIIKLIADQNINIVDIVHNRVFTSTNAYQVKCSFDLETLNTGQQKNLLALLRKDYEIRREF